MAQTKELVRLAAIGDIHYGKNAVQGSLQPLFAQITETADVLVLCGDLTDHGRVEEAQGVSRMLVQSSRVPIVAVLGNHDYESGQHDAVRRTLVDAGIHVLDGEAIEIGGIGFAGVKGFCGGFGPRALGAWGEPIIKSFVQEAVSETLKLETALGRLRSTPRIALLHYSPVESTVEGEPREIYPFLGSTRMEEPLVRYQVHAVFHGHAHHGRAEGRTAGGAPVFNVSLPLLQRVQPEQPFRRLTVP